MAFNTKVLLQQRGHCHTNYNEPSSQKSTTTSYVFPCFRCDFFFLLWLVLVVQILYSTLSHFAWSPLDVLNMAAISCDQIRA